MKKDLTQCGIEVTDDWYGYGLLKVEKIHDVPVDTITYNFAHLTIQEFLCAVYMSTLSDQEQQLILSEHFDDYPNVFIFFSGLTRLVSPAALRFIHERLSFEGNEAITAAKCAYESNLQQTKVIKLFPPLKMELSCCYWTAPYDCLGISHVLSCYPILKVVMWGCHIGNSGAAILEKFCNPKLLQKLNLSRNDLTVTGVKSIMMVVMKCE